MLTVIKASGQKEPFDEEKVISSIQRAGIPKSIQIQVLAHIKTKLYDGIPTVEIYKHILEFLSEAHPYSKSKYSLKQSIMMIGPTGYPFEDFIAEILKSGGYKTEVRQILLGRCVSHEIDVIAQKDNQKSMIEAKFHNNVGVRSEIHVALYTHARFLDIKERNHLDEVWLVTNTKTTSEADNYALCVGMKIISWSTPEGASLRDLIEKSRLHPITILNSLSHAQKMQLLDNHIVMCKEIYNDHTLLDLPSLSQEEKDKALAEISFICQAEI